MDKKFISKKIHGARAEVLKQYPFFGRLLLRLRFGLADCGTAFTDMRRIVFDPQFAERLSSEEIMYVMLHEVLHCALKHCTRGFGKQKFIYNIACDIVVNSSILEMYSKDEIIIDGKAIMHTAPNGKEGRLYSAEQIYTMLMKMSHKDFADMYSDSVFDIHDVWAEIDDITIEDLWNHHLKDVVAACGVGSGIPSFMARYLKEVDRSPRTNWRQILHDFIQFDKSDYDFLYPDRRYSTDIVLPSFCENVHGSKVDRLWFLVDTSGSVSDEALSVAYEEIKRATEQIENLSGMLSFFDYTVSNPEAFENVDDILGIRPIGGGGTSFTAIFKKLAEYNDIGELPNAIIIITDGYAPFPDEKDALEVPVIWIIVNSKVVPPWGAYAFISE